MNHSQRKYGPTLSDIFSSDVLHSILSSPTDTLQALNEAVDDTKVKNVTQSTKTKLQKFYNNDFVVRFNGSFAEVRSDLRKLFSMDREGATDYAVYDIPNGRMAFRLADHNANGGNFEQDSANTNISVFVSIREFDVPVSEVPYTEFKITEETFNKNREMAVRAIIDAVRNALNGQEFNIPESIAQRTDYPINESKNNVYMKKKTINESQLRKIVSESIKSVLYEKFNPEYRKNSHPTSFDDNQEKNEEILMKYLVEIRSKIWQVTEFAEQGVSGIWGWNLSPKVTETLNDMAILLERLFKEVDPDEWASYAKWHNPLTGRASFEK